MGSVNSCQFNFCRTGGVRRLGVFQQPVNPEISLILSGTATYLQHNPDDYQIAGFIPSGSEVAPGPRNFSLGGSMLNFDADVGRAFHAKLSLSLAPDSTVSLENAYI